MKALILRVAVMCTLFFTAVGLVIRARPYDDHSLRTVLLPDGCANLCFMGVQPGMTSLADGLRLLEQHEWVAAVSRPTSSEQLEIIRTGKVMIAVTWNGSQAEFFDAPSTTITFGLRGNHIQSLSIPINLTLADFWLFMGAPKRGTNTLFSVNEIVTPGRMSNRIIVTGTIRHRQPMFSIAFGPSLCSTRIGYMLAQNAVLLMSGSSSAEAAAEDGPAPPSLRYLIGCNAR